MSRQRIRTGVLESSTVSCPHCRGTGQVRSISSLSLQILRALEDQLLRNSGHHLVVRTRPEVALYVLNQKRQHLAQLESRFGLTITIGEEAPENGAGYLVERGPPVEDRPESVGAVAMAGVAEASEPHAAIDEDAEEDFSAETRESREPREPRRRRRRRRGNGDDRHEISDRPEGEDEAEAQPEARERGPRGERRAEGESEGQDRRKRRGRRGGRRRGRGRSGDDFSGEGRRRWNENGDGEHAGEAPAGQQASDVLPGADFSQLSDAEDASQRMAEMATGPFAPDETPEADASEPFVPQNEERYASRNDFKSGDTSGDIGRMPDPVPPPEPAPAPQPIEDDRPKRSGWWSRKGSL
jgi:ribonuclease E